MPSGSIASLFSFGRVDERNARGKTDNVGGDPTPHG